MQIRLVEVVRLGLVLCAMQIALQAQRPEILYLRFSESTGTTTLDRAVPGIGSAATIQNGAGFNGNTSTVNGSVFAPGCLRTANSTTDPCYTNAPFVAIGDWTIEFLAIDTEPTNATNPPIRFLFGEPSTGLACFRDPAGSNATIQLSGAGMNTVPCTAAVAFATWRHIAFVHDSRARTITPYVNGVARPSVAQPASIDINGTAGTGLTIGGNGIGNAIWQGRMDEFRVWNRALSSAEIAGQGTAHVNSAADDLALTSIVNPITPVSGCRRLTTTEFIEIEVVNTGTNMIPAGTMVMVEIRINGGTPVLTTSAAVPNTLLTGDKTVITMPTSLDLTALPAFILEATIFHTGDLVALNDKAVRTLLNGAPPVTAYPSVQDFSGTSTNNTIIPPTAWVQEQADAVGPFADWVFTNQASPTAGTGPLFDNTTGAVGGNGYYALIEDGGNHANVSLTTNCYDLTALTMPALKFFLYSDNFNGPGGANENFLSIDVIDTTTGGVTSIIPDVQGAPYGHVAVGWVAQNIDLSAFAGTISRIIFRGTSNGGADTHDIAIDDVTVFESIPGTGQAPRPGLALMDINNSLSPGLTPVSSMDNGPYSAFATPGSLISFDFEGEQSQIILVLFGNKNPLAATFGATIGQLDIGGPLGINGLPTGMQIFADGASSFGFNPFFRTTPAGVANVFFTMPSYPPGVLTTFQSVIRTGNAPFNAITNAVEVIVN